MLSDVLRLLAQDGSLLPGEVARHLGVSLEEAVSAIEVLAAAGRLSRYRLEAGCPGVCGSCRASGHCLPAEGPEEPGRPDPFAAAGPARPA